MGQRLDKKDSSSKLGYSEISSHCPNASPMTSEEVEILAKLRSIKMQAREVKSYLAAKRPDWKKWINDSEETAIPKEATTQLQYLEELRTKWKRLEQAYKEARHRRMLALGHEDL
jgi:hypothetical protein